MVLAALALIGGCTPTVTVPAQPAGAALERDPALPLLDAEQSAALLTQLVAQFNSQPNAVLTPSSAGRQLVAQLAALDPALLTRNQRSQLILLTFSVGLSQHRFDGASALRQHPDWWQWRGELRGANQRRLDTLEADYLIAIGNFADGLALLLEGVEDGGRDAANRVWALLTSQPNQSLTALGSDAALEVRQLAKLALQLRTSEGDYPAQLGQLERWLAEYPRQPLARSRPDYFIALAEQRAALAPIAVVLGSDDDSVAASAALSDGLLARYYQLAAHQTLPPLQFYRVGADSSYRDLYRQLRSAGVGRVIGPLRRSQLDRLATELLLAPATQPTAAPAVDGDSSVSARPAAIAINNLLPTLALNELPDQSALPASAAEQFSQLPLAVEHELAQLLERALARSANRILVLAPGAGWGARGAHWLQQRWLQSGGEISISYYSGSERDYTPLLQAPLALDASRQRSRDIERLTGLDLDSRPRRRQDIDLIILLAQPEQGRQIRPALDFNFAADLPVLATSHIYPGDDRYNRDLAGIEFPASLWQLEASTEQTSDELLSATVSRQLTALGADALIAALREAQLGRVDAPLYGSSGVLLASAGNYRRLGLWHQITERGTVAISAAVRDQQAARNRAGGGDYQ